MNILVYIVRRIFLVRNLLYGTYVVYRRYTRYTAAAAQVRRTGGTVVVRTEYRNPLLRCNERFSGGHKALFVWRRKTGGQKQICRFLVFGMMMRQRERLFAVLNHRAFVRASVSFMMHTSSRFTRSHSTNLPGAKRSLRHLSRNRTIEQASKVPALRKYITVAWWDLSPCTRS